MWVRELQGTDQCNVKNVVTLLVGILKIYAKDILIS